jgi:hypothetical protein
MSVFGKRMSAPRTRRSNVRRTVGLAGSVVALDGAKSVLVEDLCPNGARLLGRHLPGPGEQVLLRTSELAVLGRISWANGDFRGVVFEEGDRPSAGECLALQLQAAA